MLRRQGGQIIRACIVSSVGKVRRPIIRSLASMGCEIYPCNLERGEIDRQLAERRDLFIVDADGSIPEVQYLLGELSRDQRGANVLIVAQDFENPLIYEVVEKQNLNHLIAKQGALAAFREMIDEQELIVTCHKLCHRDIFGLEKYLSTCGIVVRNCELEFSDEKEAVLREVQDFLKEIDCYGPLAPLIMTVADELLMNAIFNAPCDKDGKKKYASLNRKEKFPLGQEDRVVFRYACDGRYVALSVTDLYGSLDREIIVRYLKQKFIGDGAQIEQKAGGAGIGLHMVFSSITQLVFNIHPGTRTEVIALFYIRSGMRAFKESGRSLNIFLER